ncbi:DUF5312 family protein [Treponema pectinovorum]|uniref:DUF5312 family protein n=1 Tax=Treponema pectinovorum TaxID=164 RepID=UPI003D8ED420
MAKLPKMSIFKKLFSSLFGSNDPEADKKRMLKKIAKDLSRSGYKFYKAGSDQILPAFGKFFYEVYKAISPAQVFFNGHPNPNFYKNMAIEFSLSKNQLELSENLTEESILTLAKNMPFDKLKAKLKQDFESFAAEFDMEKIAQIDGLYLKLLAFKAFCTYDYYFMLKKFDSSIREGEFNRSPKMESIEGAYVAEDLKDFASILYSLPLDQDWSDLMNMFKSSRGSEPIKPNQWNKIVQRLRSLRDNRVFDMMIQLITKDPSYATDVTAKSEQVIESYIENMRQQTENTLKKLEREQKNSKIDSILTQIFNTNSVVILHHYTEGGSAAFEKKDLGDFTYAKPLNYLKAFLNEFVKRDVREYADLVLIRGKWAMAPLSAEMSNNYHAMFDASDKITAFDDKLAEDKEVGTKLKTLLPRADRDREAKNIIKTILKDTNSLAREYLVETTKAIIGFAKTLKVLIEDHKKQKPEILTNWKELERFAEHPIDELGIEVYKKMYLLAQLMQEFLA